MLKPSYLLDTNIVSQLVRRPHGAIAERISLEGEGSVCTSIIVASELRFGVRKRGAEQLSKQVEQVLSAMQVLPFEAPADRLYAKLRFYLEEKGTLIGPNDMLIAAQALALECTVVTHNVREFTRVPGLTVMDWSAG